MTTTKKQLETAAKYKAMGWHELEASSRGIVLEKHGSIVRVQKNGKTVKEVVRV